MISIMQPLTQAGAASEPGFALKVAEARKLASHNAECRNIGILFLPVVVETLGGWSPDSITLISRIGKLVAVADAGIQKGGFRLIPDCIAA